jgi:uncharacterized protein
MTLHTVHLLDCPLLPWRNGGGVARDLLFWPTTAPQADWQLRVSVARIDRDGPFSHYPGVQRCFSVLSGHGVQLDLPRGAVRLHAGDEAIAFDGADAPPCTLLDGPTDDLNLMALQGAGRPLLRRAAAGLRIEGTTLWRGVYAQDAMTLDLGGHAQSLAAGTLAWSDAPDLKAWQLIGSGQGWLLSLES